MVGQRLLSPAEAAAQLGIGRTTFYRLIRKGEVRTFTIGRLRKVSESDLSAYIEHMRLQEDEGG